MDVIDSDKDDIEQNKDLAAFSYLWVMSVLVYFFKRKSSFVRFHSKQAMVLFALSIIVLFIPYLNRVLELVILCLMVFGFINAAQGQRKDIPLIGPLSRGDMSVRDAWRGLVKMIGNAVRSVKTPEVNHEEKKSDEHPSPPTS